MQVSDKTKKILKWLVTNHYTIQPTMTRGKSAERITVIHLTEAEAWKVVSSINRLGIKAKIDHDDGGHMVHIPAEDVPWTLHYGVDWGLGDYT